LSGLVSTETKALLTMEGTLRDIRLAVRVLARAPGFTALTVLTMALGIGGNAAIFSVVNAVLLRPLPFEDSQRIVTVWSTNPRFDVGFTNLPVSTGDFIAWREESKSFEQLSVVSPGTINLIGGPGAERIEGAFVSPRFFDLLRVTPVQGRSFLADEEEPGHEQVIVISDGFWERHFSRRPDAVGSTLTAENKTYTIVGVAPPGFNFPHSNDLPSYSGAPAQPEFWAPAAFSQQQKKSRADHQLCVVGRLRPGVSAGAAQADVDAITKRLELSEGGKEDVGAVVLPLQDEIVGGVRPALIMLACAIGFVLLIACANVANLQLARATTRMREVAVRTALGASRWRIVRQLLIESLAVSLAGGIAGLALNSWGLDALIRLAPRNIPRLDEIGSDWRVLGFGIVVSLLTGLAFGLVPAVQASKVDLNQSLKDAGRNTPAAGGSRARSMLVLAEVAISVVLLVGAGLLLRSFWRLLSVDPGFDPGGVFTVSLDLSRTRYPEASQQSAFFDRLLERVKAVPGVVRAGAISGAPLSGFEYSGGFSIEGRADADADDSATADRRAVSHDYFNAMGIPLISGRFFDDHDGPNSEGVALVSESWARRFLDGESPLGHRLKLGGRDSTRPWLAIVGVVGDVHQSSLESKARPCIYCPYRQFAFASMTLVVRTHRDPGSILTSIRNDVAALDKDQPLTSVAALSDYLNRSVAGRRFNAMLMLVFGATAVALAALGIYGAMAYSVAQRTHEIGVRMAVGARPRDIRVMVLRRGLTLTFTGAIVGLAGAILLTRFMSSLVFEIKPTDPATFFAVPLILGAVATAACLVPARRATKIDPIGALRHE
jgi:putative ABC transport system permease protein